jgi:hypothetical protein
MGAAEVACPQARRQAVAAVIGHAHCFRFVLETKHRQHRAEHLLACQRVVRTHLVEHRGLHIAAAGLHLGPMAAEQQAGALAFGPCDIGQHLVHVRGIDQRAHRCIGLQWMLRLHVLAVGNHLVHEVLTDRALHQQPRAGGADFALVEEDALRHGLGRCVQVGASANTVRALATAFQPDPLEVGPPAYSSSFAPVAVEPVKASTSTSMCSANGSPTRVPWPGSTFSTPSGRPASAASAASRNALKGDRSEGLSTTELPMASAGAIFQQAISNGNSTARSPPPRRLARA